MILKNKNKKIFSKTTGIFIKIIILFILFNYLTTLQSNVFENM